MLSAMRTAPGSRSRGRLRRASAARLYSGQSIVSETPLRLATLNFPLWATGRDYASNGRSARRDLRWRRPLLKFRLVASIRRFTVTGMTWKPPETPPVYGAPAETGDVTGGLVPYKNPYAL